jgi:tRNA pseudouridine55 synthase
VSCGKGTYIRAIVRDLGMALGHGAHVEALRRLSLGAFHVSDACSLEDLKNLNDIDSFLRPLGELGRQFHRVVLTQGAERRLLNGLWAPLAEAGRYFPAPGTVGLDKGLCVESEKGSATPMIGFVRAVRSKKGSVLLKSEVNIIE